MNAGEPSRTFRLRVTNVLAETLGGTKRVMACYASEPIALAYADELAPLVEGRVMIENDDQLIDANAVGRLTLTPWHMTKAWKRHIEQLATNPAALECARKSARADADIAIAVGALAAKRPIGEHDGQGG